MDLVQQYHLVTEVVGLMCASMWQQQTQYHMYDLIQSARANVFHFYATLCSDKLMGVATTSTAIVL